MASPLPDRIDRYEVVSRLGRGGMGEVFLATDPVLGRTVAIKMLTEDNEELRERFAREARSAAALNHHNIVTIYDVGEDAGRPFIAMEYLDGETMAELIRRRAPLTTRRRLDLLLELCAGLGHAHRSGIVHRDIKPANLMITSEGTLKILDFGIARVKEDATSSGLTRVGMLIGSPHYRSPEQADGLPVDDRSDIFAVGSVFYELLTGERAFPGDNAQVVINKILTRPHRPVRDLQPDLDPEIGRIVDKALAKDLAERYPTLAALAADVSRVRDRYRHDEAGDTVRLPRESIGAGPVETPRTPTPAFKGALDSKEIARRRAAQIDVLLGEASGHLRAGAYEAAIEQAEKALLIDPGETRVLEMLQRAHRSIEARQIQQWLEEAESLKADGALTGAERLIAQSLQLQPDSPEAGASMADLKERRRTRERAAERARAVRAAIAKGRASLDAGAFEAAERSAGEALAFDPEDADARELKQAARAAIEARDALERRASDAVALAQQRASNDDTRGAIELLRSFVPSHPQVTAALADIERAGAERAARREAERLEQEELERTRIAMREAERREAERREAERRELERVAAERREAERVDAERREADRQEADRLAARQREAARVEAERREAARIEVERREDERREAERRDAERLQAEAREVERTRALERNADTGATIVSEATEGRHVGSLGGDTQLSQRLETRDDRQTHPAVVRPWYRRIEVAGPLAAAVIGVAAYAVWPSQPRIVQTGNQATPEPPPVDRAVAARETIARAENVYASGRHEDAIAILAGAPQHALIEAKLGEWRARLSSAERDKDAEAAAAVARKQFASGQYEQALQSLASFEPAHPAVTETLQELRAELEKVAARVVAESRKRSDTDALASLERFRPAHRLVTNEIGAIRGRLQQQEGAVARARQQSEAALKSGDLAGAVRFAQEGLKGRDKEPTLTQLINQAVAVAATNAGDARRRADGIVGASSRPEYRSATTEQQSAENARATRPTEAIAGFGRAAKSFESAAAAADAERAANATVASMLKEVEAAIGSGRLDEADDKLKEVRGRAAGHPGIGPLEDRIRTARAAARGTGNRGAEPPATKPNAAELAARSQIEDVLARFGRAMTERKEDDLTPLWQRKTTQLEEQQGVIRTNGSIRWVPRGAAQISLTPDGRGATAELVVDRTVETLRERRRSSATLTYRFQFVSTGAGWKIQTVTIDR